MATDIRLTEHNMFLLWTAVRWAWSGPLSGWYWWMLQYHSMSTTTEHDLLLCYAI